MAGQQDAANRRAGRCPFGGARPFSGCGPAIPGSAPGAAPPTVVLQAVNTYGHHEGIVRGGDRAECNCLKTHVTVIRRVGGVILAAVVSLLQILR